MIIFKDLSIFWSLVHALVLFILLFESKYSQKKTIQLSLYTMGPLIIANLFLWIFLGNAAYLKIMLLSCSLPSLLFFYFLAKHRDGRFLFTFCMADTIIMELLYITNIIEFFIPGDNYLFLFFSRLMLYPTLDFFVYKKLRTNYLIIQEHVTKGWYHFTAISAIFYILMTISMSVPTMITERLEDLPALILIFILMPLIYIQILFTLHHQKKMHDLTEQDNILKIQVSNMSERIQEFYEADEKFRIERHNMRHKMQTIAGLLEKKEYEELSSLIAEYNKAIQETKVKRYCSNPVLDAVLASYLQKAEEKEIQIRAKIILPDTLPVKEAELATVFANAIENAINACENVEKNQRYLDVKALDSPRFMIQITNSFDGSISFNENNVPISHETGHGFGTKFIVAFCEKYGAFYEFKAQENRFTLRIGFDR